MLKVADCVDSRLKTELSVPNPIGRGRSRGAKLVQELFRLHKINVVIDGDFGDATEAALADFCKKAGIAVTNTVDQSVMDHLAQPLLRVAAPAAPKADLNATIVGNARRHLAEHPIEIGGQNRGPWVRLYMAGSEGNAFPWCAGFVTYVLRQAAKAHGQESPLERTFSCDVMGMEAIAEERFVKKMSPAKAPDGSVFLVPNPANSRDWVHTGIIIDGNAAGPGTTFLTIEGNTNDEGSREGFEVCERRRSCAKVDVVLMNKAG